MDTSKNENYEDLLSKVKNCSPAMQEEIRKELSKDTQYLEKHGIKAFLKKHAKEKEKKMLNEDGFWPSWGAKLFFTLISVKFWGLTASIWITTRLLLHEDKLLDGAQWVTFNTTVWGLIYGMREVFRIAEGRDKMEKQVIEMNNPNSANTN